MGIAKLQENEPIMSTPHTLSQCVVFQLGNLLESDTFLITLTTDTFKHCSIFFTRGKTYIAKKLSRYLNWIGINTKGDELFEKMKQDLHWNRFCESRNLVSVFFLWDKNWIDGSIYFVVRKNFSWIFYFFSPSVLWAVFNLGEYRRMATPLKSHHFFKQENVEAMSVRAQCALDALEDVCKWLEAGGEVGVSHYLDRNLCSLSIYCLTLQVFDATNTTFERRQLIREIIVDKMGYKLFFVESVCDDPAIIESNIRQVKITSPDYANMDKEAAVEDFLQRIDHYHDQYQTLDEVEEDCLSFMKVFNTGTRTSFLILLQSRPFTHFWGLEFRWESVGPQTRGSHPITHRLLPHEHSYHAKDNLFDTRKFGVTMDIVFLLL